ncbi:MAG: hypothetical protein NC339_01155 [Muribaculaceae bacterium]|nr:hypothetical protein [Muribaculaceae bacterium]
MKKTLLTLLGAVAFATVQVSAGPLSKAHTLKAEPMSTEKYSVLTLENSFQTAPGPQKAAGVIDYTLAGDPYTCLGFKNMTKGNQMATAFEITPEVSTKFAGSKITAVSFYTGINGNTDKNDITIYYVWVSEGDLISGTSTGTQPLAQKGSMVSTEPQQSYTVKFDEPVTIEAGKRYYVGTRFTVAASTDYPIVIDYEPTSALEGGWVATRANADAAWQWDNIAPTYGNNCLACRIEGNNLPEDEVLVSAIEASLSAKAGQPFEVDFMVKNNAANQISTIEYTCQVGTDAPITKTAKLDNAISYGQTSVVSMLDAVASTSAANTPVTITVTKVDGFPNQYPDASATTTLDILPAGKGYDRNLVIEEGTSIWCGWCPFGIGAFEYIRDKYTDGSLIPVAVHSPFNGQNDPMTSSSYYEFIQNYISAFPTAIISRYFEVSMGTPQIGQIIDQYYDLMHQWPSPVRLDMDVRWADSNKKSIEFVAKTTYVWDYDTAPDYLLSFAIKEDQVGPYNQQNYLNGQYNFYGWGTKGSVVSWKFDDVARDVDGFRGVAGSIPSKIEADKEYKYSHIMQFGSNVSNAQNVTAICYLLNTKTGVIETAISVPASKFLDYDPSSIESIDAAETEAPVEYFNLQGIRVDNPQGGVYIRRQGNTVTKVVK